MKKKKPSDPQAVQCRRSIVDGPVKPQPDSFSYKGFESVEAADPYSRIEALEKRVASLEFYALQAQGSEFVTIPSVPYPIPKILADYLLKMEKEK